MTTFDQNYERALAAVKAPETPIAKAKKLIGHRIETDLGNAGTVIKVEKDTDEEDPVVEVLAEQSGDYKKGTGWTEGVMRRVSLSKIVRSTPPPKPGKGRTTLVGLPIWSSRFWRGVYVLAEQGDRLFVESFTSMMKEPKIIVDRHLVEQIVRDPYKPGSAHPVGAQLEHRGIREPWSTYVHPASGLSYNIHHRKPGERTIIDVPRPASRQPLRWRDGRYEKFVGGTWRDFA
jgi:hypothetical protein